MIHKIRTILILVLLMSSCSTPTEPSSDHESSDPIVELMAGRWQITRFVIDKQEPLSRHVMSNMTLSLYTDGTFMSAGETERQHGVYRIVADKSPMWISTVAKKGPKIRIRRDGIFKLTEDKLVCAFATSSPRPKSFELPLDKGVVLVEYTRLARLDQMDARLVDILD